MRKLKVMSWIFYTVFLVSAGNAVRQLILTDNINVAKIYAFSYMIGLAIVAAIYTISITNR